MDAGELKDQLERLHPACFGWAIACSRGDRDLATEALQMAYVEVLDGTARWEGRSTLRTWLFGVIRHKVATLRRRSWLRSLGRVGFERADATPDPASNPERAAAAGERARFLRRALEQISPRQREVLHLVFYHGFSIDEAAGVLGVAPGTARLHYERGKERLRALLPSGARS